MGISASVIDPADLHSLEVALEKHNVRRDLWVHGGLAGSRCSGGRRQHLFHRAPFLAPSPPPPCLASSD